MATGSTAALARSACAPGCGIPRGIRIQHCGLTIDSDRFRVAFAGAEIRLTFTEFLLLLAIAGEPGRVYSREELVAAIRRHRPVLERNVDVHVSQIRKKLGPGRRLIVTVRGIGYCMKA